MKKWQKELKAKLDKDSKDMNNHDLLNLVLDNTRDGGIESGRNSALHLAYDFDGNKEIDYEFRYYENLLEIRLKCWLKECKHTWISTHSKNSSSYCPKCDTYKR